MNMNDRVEAEAARWVDEQIERARSRPPAGHAADASADHPWADGHPVASTRRVELVAPDDWVVTEQAATARARPAGSSVTRRVMGAGVLVVLLAMVVGALALTDVDDDAADVVGVDAEPATTAGPAPRPPRSTEAAPLVPIAVDDRSEPTDSPAVAATTEPPPVATTAPATTTAPPTTTVPTTTAPSTTVPTTTAPPPTTAPATTTAPPPTTSVPPATVPPCAGTYVVVAGDTWSGLAQGSGRSLAVWLAANGADAGTPLLIGDELCVPVGAQAPVPSTSAPATTSAPPTTTVPTTVPPTTTTLPPTTSTGSPTTSVPPTTVPPCAGTYVVVAGDTWSGLAQGSGRSLAVWLAANGADAGTPLLIGDELCVPVGAQAPVPSTTAPATTTLPPTTTVPTTTAPPTTVPATTVVTPAPSPTTTAPEGAVQRLIREVWPDELEEQALAIAYRESRYQADVYNGVCCYGVFQIYFEANEAWLATQGVTSAQQLLDARTNIEVAYAMYLRSGWAPWRTTAG